MLWWNPSNRGRGYLSPAAAECLMALLPQKKTQQVEAGSRTDLLGRPHQDARDLDTPGENVADLHY